MNKFSLDKHPKITSGFTAPENYFDNFSTVILEKINLEEPKKSKVFALKNFTYAAAAVVVLLLSIPFLTSNSTLSFEEIDTASLENYISFQSNVSQYELINLMDYKELDAIQVEMNLEDEALESIIIANPNFENYMLE